jgi:hypothetical protein
MVATVNSVVGGSAIALAVGRLLDAPLGVAAVAGALVVVASFALHRRWDQLLHHRSGGHHDVLFPSP